MCPERFDVETTAPNAENLYNHWKLTFTNYLRSNNEGENKLNNCFAFINTISADVFDMISDVKDFVTAMEVLDAAYIKPTNIIYNRYQLVTSKQQPATSNRLLPKKTRRNMCEMLLSAVLTS